ncbi:hypothetical protein CN563_08745 [Bacillus sp. AFS026049]|nr:hypothetical protein CON84_16985 [Bacillus sp. AFS094228]PEO48574.1 hypothetical protein CN563_08745 [Bacillus sp. AFS026049]
MKGECIHEYFNYRGQRNERKADHWGIIKKLQTTVYGMTRKEEQAQTIKELGGHPICRFRGKCG